VIKTNPTSISSIAVHLALSRTAVRDLEIEGVLDRANGIDACRLAYIRHLRMRRPHAADDRLRTARAKAIELRTQREAHDLVHREESLGVIDAVIGKLVVHLNMIPARCTRDLALQKTIESEINRARSAAADECDRQAQSLRTTGRSASPNWS
jgi:hypothetical protein